MNFNKYKIIISGIILGVLFWIIESIMHTLVFNSEGDLIHHLFFTDAHEIWMRSMTILFVGALSVYSQIIFNKVKTNEQKLKESEEKFHLLFDTIPDALYIIDQETGKILDVNKAAEKMYGYSREEWLQMKNTDVSAEPDKTKKATYKLPSQIPIRYHKKKDGTIFPLEMMISSYTLNNQRLIIATGRDITERKKSEEELMKYHDHLEELVEERTEALRESEEKFRTISEQSIMGITMIQDDRYKYVNQAAADMLGYTVEEMLDAPQGGFMNYIHPEDREFVREQATKKQMGRKDVITKYPYRCLTKSGETIWVQNYSCTITYEGKYADLITMIDFTERKKAQKSLKESEEKYRNLFEQTPMAILLINFEGIIEDCNTPTEVLFGYTKEELLGNEFLKFDIFPLDSKLKLVKSYSKFLKTGVPEHSEIQLCRKDGKMVWIESYPIIVKIAEISYILVVIQDITERKKAEKELQLERDKLINILSSMEDGVYIVDKNYDIEYVNPILTKEFGQYEGKKCYKYFHDRNESCPWCKNQEVFEGKTVRWEWNSFKNQKTYDLIDTPLKNVDGSVSKLEIFHDITELKKNEQKLKESEEKFRTLTEQSLIGITIFQEGYVKYVNKAAAESIGYPLEELENWSIQDVFNICHPEDLPFIKEKLKKRDRNADIELENSFRILTKLGETRWINLISKPIIYQGTQATFTITQNITDRVLAEQRLQENERLLKNAQELSQIGHWKLDTSTMEVTGSDELLKIMGHAPNEVTLEYLVAEFVHPEDREMLLFHIRRGMEKGESWDIEYRVISKDGPEKWVHSLGEAIKIGDSKVISLRGTVQDITERKKAEQKLKESEEKYRYLFNHAQVGLFWSRISDGKFLECNDTFAKLVGYDTREECLADYIALDHYLDLNVRNEMLEEIRINNEVKDFEIQVTKRDGTSFWASISARANLKENRIEGAAIDITARKEAEQKLKESEEKYRLISENANDLIYIFNERYEFEYINEQAFMKCLGHSKDDLIGKSTIEFIHPADLKRVSKELRKGFKSGRGLSELRIRHKNGTYRWLEVRGTLFIDKNEKRKALLIGRDVTEKKQAEKEIRESEVKYRHLFETSPYFIGLVNSEGILIDCNDAINDILSIHTIEDVIGKSFKEIFLLNEKSTHLIPIFEKFIKSIFEGVTQEGFDFRLNRSIGDYLWIHIEGTLIEIEEQKLIQFIMQDITERKRSEQLLQESIEELAKINTELEQFTYIASHDLKEPLRMVSSFAQLLEKRYKDKLDENANDFIKFITEGVARMQDLINSLLAYSRIGKHSKEFEKVDLNDVLKDVIDNLSQLINETNAEVIYDSLPSLFVDKNQLLQVFQNLISNAIKFRGIDPPLVRISARPDDKHWVFSIRDNGIGIDPKEFERIFIIFQRLHTKDEYSGTGIGLAICKKIVERYGGKMWVESEVGKGSTFYFSIPKK